MRTSEGTSERITSILTAQSYDCVSISEERLGVGKREFEEARIGENLPSPNSPKSPHAELLEFVRRPEWGWGEDGVTIAQKLLKCGNSLDAVNEEFRDAAAKGYTIDELREIAFAGGFYLEDIA